MKVKILEKWSMDLEESDAEETWFADWVLRSPKEVSTHLTAGWHAYNAIRDFYNPGEIRTAVEYFGGMGAQALMIEHLFQPHAHVVQDYSAQAVEHMNRELPNRISVIQGDSYNPSWTPWSSDDVVGLDFGDLTVWKTRDGEKHRRLLDRVFAHHPKAVVLTDIAGPRLHLQRERYETLLGIGTCQTYEGYLEAFSDRLYELYGYHVVTGFTHRWSTVLTLVPKHIATSGDFRLILPTPSTPVGLELV